MEAIDYDLKDTPGAKKITPKRYVWHLSLKSNRKAILKNGLDAKISQHKCLFANNQSQNIKDFYPYCIEKEFKKFDDAHYLDYDYWRIDTSKVIADWYIDPNMANIPNEYSYLKSKYFIATESSIPSSALKLYKISKEYISREKYITVNLLCEKETKGEFYEDTFVTHEVIDNIQVKEELNSFRSCGCKIIKTRDFIYIQISNKSFQLVKNEEIEHSVLKKLTIF